MNMEVVAPEEVGMSSARLERIRPAMQAYVDHKGFPGISTMVARRGKLVHFEQVGRLDIESNVPMSGDAIFRIYSMTKPIVSTALMILYEHGRFQLFDPVAKYIPAFGDVKVLESDGAGGTKEVDAVRPITIRDLLLHTAGLTYGHYDDSPVCELYRQARLFDDAGRDGARAGAAPACLPAGDPMALQPWDRCGSPPDRGHIRPFAHPFPQRGDVRSPGHDGHGFSRASRKAGPIGNHVCCVRCP